MLSQHFQKETTDLIQYILTTTYFVHDGRFYEQTDGVAVESPLAPVKTDLCMESFEQWGKMGSVEHF
jgi:hypothetical protein